MALSRAIDDFITYLRGVERLAPKTCIEYEKDLRLVDKLAARDKVTAFTPDLVDRVMAALNGKGLATVRRHVAAMRKFAAWGVQRQLWRQNPTSHLPRMRSPRRHPKPFVPDELDRLMSLELPLQQRAIRAVLFYTGMRAGALCALRVEDVHLQERVVTKPDGSTVTEPGYIVTKGKGGHETRHPVHPDLKAILWDQGQEALAREKSTLFWRRDGGPLNHNALDWMCKEWGRRAGVAKVHPHKFRHSFATEMLRQGKSVATIKTLMGHASITTTMGYAEVDDALTVDAVLSLRTWGTPAQPVELDAEIAAVEARLAELRRLREHKDNG